MLSDVLKNRRTELGLTLLDIAKKMGVSEATVQRWECGSIKTLRQGRIAQLACILDISPAVLMGWDNTPSYDVYNIIPLPEGKSVPLIGSIACGVPALAEENIEMYVRVDKSIPADFALRCEGDSMITARIFDGDIVFIRKQADVDNGQIAAVLIGEEATLKEVYKYPEQHKLVLRPCNPQYKDLIFTEEQLAEVHILGKAVAFTSLIK